MEMPYSLPKASIPLSAGLTGRRSHQERERGAGSVGSLIRDIAGDFLAWEWLSFSYDALGTNDAPSMPSSFR